MGLCRSRLAPLPTFLGVCTFYNNRIVVYSYFTLEDSVAPPPPFLLSLPSFRRNEMDMSLDSLVDEPLGEAPELEEVAQALEKALIERDHAIVAQQVLDDAQACRAAPEQGTANRALTPQDSVVEDASSARGQPGDCRQITAKGT